MAGPFLPASGGKLFLPGPRKNLDPWTQSAPFFPFNGIRDTFDRADESPLAGGWLGPIENAQPQLKIVSNQAADVGASYGQSYWSTLMGADQEVFCDIAAKTVGASATIGVWTRIQNPGDTSLATGYLLFVNCATGLVRLQKLTAGHTYTNLSGGFLTQPVSNGDGVGLSSIVDRHYFWYRVGASGSWKLIGVWSDASISGSGYIGLGIDDTTGRVDNFGGGEIPVVIAASESPTPGGATAAGVEPTVQVPVPQGGALAAGNSPPASVAVPQGGATAGGPSPSVSVSVPQGGANAGGFAPTPATSLTISGATAGGFAPTARVTTTISGAIAGGNAPTSAASVDLGGSNTGGFGATVRVSLTIGGAVAGGFAPSESSSVTDTTTIGGAAAGGFGPTVRVAVGAGGATAGGYGPNDGSAPVAGPPGDPNYFLLIHP